MAQRQFRSDDTDPWLYGFGNSVDGDLTVAADATEAPIDASCSGTSGTTSLSATNASFASGQLLLIHQVRGTGVGAWELNRIASYTAGTITLSHNLMNTYTDSGASQAQVRVMPQYNNVTINSTKTLTAKAWTGDVGGVIAFFAKSTTVTGNITATGKGYLGGSGGTGSANQIGCQGEGTSAARDTRSASANGNGGGGGGANNSSGGGGGGGGGGGHSASGSNGNGVGNAGGTGGVAGLTTMIFGGGGAGGGSDDSAGQPGAAGGLGGGIILIISKAFSCSGTMTTAGGNGSTATAYGGGGGGGAGGSTLIKSQTATLGTALITAAAGTAGAGGGGGTQGGNGGNGSVGRIHLDYKTSYTGTTTPTLDARQDTTLNDAATGWFAFM